MYTPLDHEGQYIRVLALHPSGQVASQISCSLRTIKCQRPSAVKYEALSYTWGQPADGYHILVDDVEFTVTPNLYHALRRLRLPSEDRIVWVDAICINQHDLEERSQQVQRMREIYANAERVLIWLGEAGDGPEREDEVRAMQTLSEICRWSVVPRSGTMIRIEPAQVRHIYPALSRIFRRAWWTRVWVVQEVVAASVAIVSCGACWVPFDAFRSLQWTIRMDRTLSDEEREELFGLDVLAYAEFNQVFSELINHVTHGSQAEHVHLGDLLQNTSRRKATDLRDKVYGILGLLWPPPGDALKPDYSLSTPAVYQKAMHYALDTGRNARFGTLNILQHASNEKHYDLPTWCIDFSTETWRPGLITMSSLNGKEVKASGSAKQPPIDFRPGFGAILLQGILIGKVQWREEIVNERPEDRKAHGAGDLELPIAFLTAMLRFHQVCLGCLQRRVGLPQAIHEVGEGCVWHTFDRGGCYLPEYPKGRSGPPQATDSLALLGPFLSCRLADTSWSDLAEPMKHDLCVKSAPRLQQGLHDLAVRFGRNTVFATDNDYFGVADCVVENGDVIAIIYDLQAPVVLRARGEAFELVGCCFLHGAMGGQLVDLGQFDEQTFCLA